jgi:hypothetical protein
MFASAETFARAQRTYRAAWVNSTPENDAACDRWIRSHFPALFPGSSLSDDDADD